MFQEPSPPTAPPATPMGDLMSWSAGRLKRSRDRELEHCPVVHSGRDDKSHHCGHGPSVYKARPGPMSHVPSPMSHVPCPVSHSREGNRLTGESRRCSHEPAKGAANQQLTLDSFLVASRTPHSWGQERVPVTPCTWAPWVAPADLPPLGVCPASSCWGPGLRTALRQLPAPAPFPQLF